MCVCVCVCVFFPFILDIKFVGRTSRGTQEEGHTGFLIHLPSAVRALIFLARRIQPFLPLSTVKSNFEQQKWYQQILPEVQKLARHDYIKSCTVYTVVQQYVCVCVCFLSIHSGHQIRWTYQPGSHRRKVTQDFSSTFLLRCVP